MLRHLSLSLLTLTALAAATAGSAGAVPGSCSRVASGTGGSFGSFDAKHQPGPCWRPYSPESPFNQPIPATAKVREDSAAIVTQLTRDAPISDFYSGDPHHDDGVPIYWSDRSDPVYTLHCAEDWGHCDVEGLRIHVPAEARSSGRWLASPPESDHDAQMAIVDQRTGWEYDLWNVRHKDAGGGRLSFSDTTGDRRAWGIEVESQQSYTSFHLPNPLIGYGRSLGLRPRDFWGDGYRAIHFPVPARVDWSRMRVLEAHARGGGHSGPPGRGAAR